VRSACVTLERHRNRQAPDHQLPDRLTETGSR
jgi:hypothetical protein